MSFISYAQNFEDVMLWRAFRHIDNGFYIDVGAWSPDLDSVTRAFYERDWHGINIEPNPEINAQLHEKRPNDINLRMAISDKSGTLMMNFLSSSGLSTLDESIANGHIASGMEVLKQQVEVTTLVTIWKNHVSPEQEVHFLKVDVEGLEEAVLMGNDWVHCRPWAVIVEATLPASQEESHVAWESILLSADYQFAYADGLNRFYVAQEHSELLPAFKYPPNVFDEFKLQREFEAEAKAEQAEAKAEQAEAKAEQAEAKAEQLHTELHTVYTSRSWRITVPLRWFIHQVRLSRQHGLFSRIKALVKKIARFFIRRGIAFVNARPGLRLRCATLARKLGFYESLRTIYLRFSGRTHHISTHHITSFDDLTSVKIMHVMSKVYVDKTNKGNIIYLKVNHD